MVTKVQKWGNSLGVRIPKTFAAEAEITAGSAVDVSVENGELVLRPMRSKRYVLSAMLRRITPKNIHREIVTGDPVGREVW